DTAICAFDFALRAFIGEVRLAVDRDHAELAHLEEPSPQAAPCPHIARERFGQPSLIIGNRAAARVDQRARIPIGAAFIELELARSHKPLIRREVDAAHLAHLLGPAKSGVSSPRTCAMRRRMSAMYCGSRSTKMASKPSAMQAMPVVPLTANGSTTVPPGGVMRRTSHRIKSTGFTVGWAEPSRSAASAFAL